ncbi:RNA 2',3'-cyclic phosphodiesterase [Paenibacillus sacheonensis]|uniref:RNA 2',3'-cyclic phosphodiesterase n=1 Tax=Paenibacillus sacheonensis TaxID=742054 RepID=A0A7X4YMV5_9BACL|nr:RNA 2',3'-cyclic phosphodiesterase [Paenibacillus sacheonensis]MBM7563082.1 2'-5' RNA ligase [Paenibacillus sacheonensis]NBC68349.1 RNA 2',3'-cyclic phosphodiesterase [Paenibacillus sacheonensis]
MTALIHDDSQPKKTDRLFIALPLPDGIKRAIGAWSTRIREELPFRKWTNEADLHITLQFLGDTNPILLPELKAALTAAAGSMAIQPFGLSLRGMGIFGRTEQPRVLWAGIEGALEQLHRLQRLILEATAPLGFRAEERPYSPHLTIARTYVGKEGFRLPELIRTDEPSIHTSPFQWSADEIVLYRTHMHQQPMYEAVARFRLV